MSPEPRRRARTLLGRARGAAVAVLALVACGDAVERTSALPVAPDAGDAATPEDASPSDPLAPDAARDAPAPDARGGDGACAGSPAAVDGGARVRVLTGNLTSGDASVYGPPAVRILRGLAPDVAVLQEMKVEGPLRAFVDAAFGPEFDFAVEPQPGAIPNGIVSRYPILASGEWDDVEVADRDFAYARIDVPGPTDLWAVSVHLKTSDAAVRSREARALVGYLQAEVPQGDFVIVGGDLNTSTETEAALTDLAAMMVVFASRPADAAGNRATNASRTRPYDWLVASVGLDPWRSPVRMGAQVYCSGLVFDSRVWTPLSDVPPVEAGDSSAPNMQHMPVVRDFVLPPS